MEIVALCGLQESNVNPKLLLYVTPAGSSGISGTSSKE